MSYIEDNLMSDETLVHVTRLHPIILAPPAMLVSFLAGTIPLVYESQMGLALIALLILIALQRLVDRLVFFVTSEFGITSKRVLGKTGFIRRHSLDIVLAKVEAVRLNQHVLGRILNYGHLEVTGTGGTEEVLKFIPDPLAFRNSIQEQISNITSDSSDLQRVLDV
jgi:uncharacterized membrane protein YdbT with pleckstrin-like domain